MTEQKYRERACDNTKDLPVNPEASDQLVDKKHVFDLIDKVSSELKKKFAIPFGHWDDDVAEAIDGTMEACVEAFQKIKKEI